MGKSKKLSSEASMERLHRQIAKELEEKNFASIEEANRYVQEKYVGKKVKYDKSKRSAKDKAQDLVYDAWDCDNPRKMIKLAEKALKLDENCADAYNILAQTKAETLEQAKEYYLKGIEAGKNSLGEHFEEYKGHFWSIHETRPFMRAMSDYSNILCAMGEEIKGINIMKEMLELNPNDNQGIRHVLITRLLILKRYLEAENLLEDYEDDFSAEWYYSKAYLYFNKTSKRYLANNALKEAMEYNPYVPLYLFGLIDMPHELPQYIGVGDENEGVSYVYEAMELWANNKKASKWFIGMYKKMEDELNRLIEQREREERDRFGDRFEEDE